MALVIKQLGVAVADAAAEKVRVAVPRGPIRIWIKNTGAVALGAAGEADILLAPETATGHDVVFDNTTFASLAAGVVKQLVLESLVIGVLSIVLGGAAGATTVDIYVVSPEPAGS